MPKAHSHHRCLSVGAQRVCTHAGAVRRGCSRCVHGTGVCGTGVCPGVARMSPVRCCRVRVRWWCVHARGVCGWCKCTAVPAGDVPVLQDCAWSTKVCVPTRAVYGNVSLKVMYICKPTLLRISDNNKSPTLGNRPISQQVRMGQKSFLPLPCLSPGLSPWPLFGFLLFVPVSLSRHPAVCSCLFWEDKV